MSTDSGDVKGVRSRSNDVEQGAGSFMTRKVSPPRQEVWGREFRPRKGRETPSRMTWSRGEEFHETFR